MMCEMNVDAYINFTKESANNKEYMQLFAVYIYIGTTFQ